MGVPSELLGLGEHAINIIIDIMTLKISEFFINLLNIICRKDSKHITKNKTIVRRFRRALPAAVLRLYSDHIVGYTFSAAKPLAVLSQ